jgi:hypothetical protein
MATRKMTFSLPEGLAARFLRRVPARDRSRYVVQALTDRLAEQDRQLIHACAVANQDPALPELEDDLDVLAGEGLEPWSDASSR